MWISVSDQEGWDFLQNMRTVRITDRHPCGISSYVQQRFRDEEIESLAQVWAQLVISDMEARSPHIDAGIRELMRR